MNSESSFLTCEIDFSLFQTDSLGESNDRFVFQDEPVESVSVAVCLMMQSIDQFATLIQEFNDDSIGGFVSAVENLSFSVKVCSGIAINIIEGH